MKYDTPSNGLASFPLLLGVFNEGRVLCILVHLCIDNRLCITFLIRLPTHLGGHYVNTFRKGGHGHGKGTILLTTKMVLIMAVLLLVLVVTSATALPAASPITIASLGMVLSDAALLC